MKNNEFHKLAALALLAQKTVRNKMKRDIGNNLFWRNIDRQIDYIARFCLRQTVPSIEDKKKINIGRLIAQKYETIEESWNQEYMILHQLDKDFHALGLEVTQSKFAQATSMYEQCFKDI